MDRSFDYTQKILVAVEYGAQPRSLTNMPASHSVFRRLTIPEVVQSFQGNMPASARQGAGDQFRQVVDERMGYWEKRVPAGQHCFVHYAIGPASQIEATFERLDALGSWVVLGVYHVEPQCSAYPFAFPSGEAINHWHPAKTRALTEKSVYWFNFFPAQPLLFEKTFAVWVLFNTYKADEAWDCNQLVALDSSSRLRSSGVDSFVQVNLNRFTSLKGYFDSAHEAGKESFTDDRDYHWYGMLLRPV